MTEPTDMVRRDDGDGLAPAIAAWLNAKAGRSGSDHTRQAYACDLANFRAALRGAALDLDSEPHAVALALQAWAGRDDPSPATFNRRVAVISSFYRYGIRHGLLALASNPADVVERRQAPPYPRARALDPASVKARMADIDRTTDAGARDYALLAVALSTGRRVREIASLRWRHVAINGDRVTLTFERTKDGKAARAALPPATARALLRWLQRRHGAALERLAPDAAIWSALVDSPRGKRGAPITPRQIENICRARLGCAAHQLRHTFIEAVRARLGHASLHTTSVSLAALEAAENPFGAAVEGLLLPPEEGMT